MKPIVLLVVMQVAVAVQAVQLANFVSPSTNSCVPINTLQEPVYSVVYAYFNTPSQSQYFCPSVLQLSTAVNNQYTYYIGSCQAFTMYMPFSGMGLNISGASLCNEDDSAISNLTTANATRSAYQTMLYNNLGLSLNLVSMLSTTVYSSLDQNGNQFSAQVVIASDDQYTSILTLAMNCSTISLMNLTINVYSIANYINVYGLAGNASVGGTVLNNFPCFTGGCCVPGFWYFNLTSSTFYQSCPCSVLRTSTSAPTTQSNAANATTKINPAFNVTAARSLANKVNTEQLKFLVLLVAFVQVCGLRMQ